MTAHHLHFASTLDGRRLSWPVGVGHLGVFGRTGSGKSTVLRALLRSAAYLDDVYLAAIDMKLVELGPWAQRFDAFATTRTQAVRLLDTVRQVIDRRLEVMAAAGIVQWEGADLVLVVDELAELVVGARAHRAEIEDAERLLDSVTRLGRAAGVSCVLCTQRPAAETIGASVRDQVGWRFAMAVSDLNTSKLITQGQPVDCTNLGDLGPGAAYWLTPSAPPVLALGDNVPASDVAGIVAATAHLRGGAPA